MRHSYEKVFSKLDKNAEEAAAQSLLPAKPRFDWAFVSVLASTVAPGARRIAPADESGDSWCDVAKVPRETVRANTIPVLRCAAIAGPRD